MALNLFAVFRADRKVKSFAKDHVGNQEDRVPLIMAGNRQNGKNFGGIVMHIVLIQRA